MSLYISVPISVTVTVKFTLTDRMGSEPNLSIKWSMTIGTMVNFDSDSEGYGHRDDTHKWASTLTSTQCHVGIFALPYSGALSFENVNIYILLYGAEKPFSTINRNRNSNRVCYKSLRFRLRYLSQIPIWTSTIVKLRVSCANGHQQFNYRWCRTW